MQSVDRISIWKFDAAPEALRKLYRGATAPGWVTLVPKAIYAIDIDRAIRQEVRSVIRYDMAEGDVVYIGQNSLTPGDIARILSSVSGGSANPSEY